MSSSSAKPGSASRERKTVTVKSRIRTQLVPALALTFGLTFGIGQAFLPDGPLEIDVSLGMLNGVTAGLYAAVLYAVRGRSSDTIHAFTMMVVGSTHVIWCVAIASSVGFVLAALGTAKWPMEGAALWLVTGSVLGLVTGSCSRSWVLLIGMHAAGVASGAIVATGGAFWPGNGIGVASAPLHIALATLLYRDTRRVFADQAASVTRCSQCGYDLVGLAKCSACPECGLHRD